MCLTYAFSLVYVLINGNAFITVLLSAFEMIITSVGTQSDVLSVPNVQSSLFLTLGELTQHMKHIKKHIDELSYSVYRVSRFLISRANLPTEFNSTVNAQHVTVNFNVKI